MKKLVTIGLCAALVAGSVQQSRGLAWLAYACVAGGTAIIGGITYFVVKGCAPKYYCMTDADGNRFYSNATKTVREANDWEITGGPYDSAEEAAAGCVITSPAGGAAPTRNLTIWRSTDAVSWTVADRIVDDPNHFEWRDTNSINLNQQMFYRVSVH